MLIYLKSLLAGFAAVLLALILLALIVAVVVTVESIRPHESAIGDQYLFSEVYITGSVPGLLISGAVVFVAGFWWAYRRSRR